MTGTNLVLVDADEFGHRIHEIRNSLQALHMALTVLNRANAPPVAIQDAKGVLQRGLENATRQMIELEEMIK